MCTLEYVKMLTMQEEDFEGKWVHLNSISAEIMIFRLLYGIIKFGCRMW